MEHGQAHAASFPVVGMGASAGGLEALRTFFEHMRADSGAAFVIVQHLDPRHPTLLPELLGRSSKMPVALVRDGMATKPNHVYVIPPNASLIIQDGVLRLSTPLESRGARAPIDVFFRSLAEDRGDNAVCILLSGSGTDGTLGTRAVKEHGGMAMAQATESAKHDSIPRSAIATGLVDYVLPAEEMPARLCTYLAHLREVREKLRTPDDPDSTSKHLAKICTILRRRTGHDFSQYKQATVLRRVQRRMTVLQVTDIAAYSDRLREEPKEVDQLFQDLLIGVTQFFRDHAAFDVLARDVIPDIVRRALPDGTIRVWTPGCSTGEEAYSIAILLREEMLRQDVKPRVQIFAGDIDDDSLDIARRATYTEGIEAHVSEDRLKRFFTKIDHTYVVTKETRELCIFSTHNLIKDPPFTRLDLLVCRNLLIYLETDLQKLLTQVFHYALRPGGYLFLGPSENLATASELFRSIDSRHRIYQRADTLIRPSIPVPLAEFRPGEARLPLGTKKASAAQTSEPGSLQILERILIQNYAPAWVVINSHGGVVYFSPRTGRFLEHPTGAPNSDLVSMARRGLRLDLRTAIHHVLKTGETMIRENVLVETDGDVQRINLIVRPLAELGKDHGFFMVIFQEIGPPRSKKESPEDLGQQVEPIVQQLESELRLTKEHLQATVEDLETANEELTSSNEELLSTNEELQSSNEELQTSKEELQSVNEELETINAELSKKVDELDSTHNDLQNLFASTRIAVLFIDPELRVKRFTPAATDVFRLIDSDLGRPITDIVPRITDEKLIHDMREVLRTRVTRTREVRTSDGSTVYQMSVLPYRRAKDVVDGVTVTFVDVTELSRSRTRLAELAAIVASSGDAIVGQTFEGVITMWNASAERMFGYSTDEAIGANVSILIPPDKAGELEQVQSRVQSGETAEPFETERLMKDRRRFPVHVTISAIRDDASRIVGTSASFRDLGEISRAKSALQLAVQQRDEFLAMLSHELRAPLAPLRTSLEIMGTDGASHEQLSKSREMMHRQVVHMATLVDQLLDVSRIASGKIEIHPRALDLASVVRATAEDYQSTFDAHRLPLVLELPGSPLWVYGDETRLVQSIGNVLHNALKFTDDGRVEIQLRADPEGHSAILTFRDTGMGMDENMLDKLFEPFSQADHTLDRRRGGLGLGLALTKGLIGLHGGTVEARSDGLGRGTEVAFRLPLIAEGGSAQKAAVRSARAPAVDGRAGSQRILIVEDNCDAAESMRLMLEITGHHVEVANDGVSALATARANKPDTIICDIGLPEMDGYAVAEAIRSDPGLRGVRLIALTGYGRSEDHIQALKAGFDAHLRKPADAASVLEALTRPRQRPTRP